MTVKLSSQHWHYFGSHSYYSDENSYAYYNNTCIFIDDSS